MVDTKYTKPVTASTSGIAGDIGGFPAPVAPGTSVTETLTTIGTGFATIINSTGTLAVELVDDNSAATATPTGLFIAAIFRSTLPTYANGDGGVLHVDSRGRLLVSSIDAGSGGSADISQEGSPGPANPIGGFTLGLYRATLPTYADGDAACFHFTSRGLLKAESTGTPSTTSAPTSIAGAVASTSLLAANTDRLGATFFNDQPTDGSGATLYLLLDAAVASTTNYTVQLAPNTYYEVPFNYVGEIRGIWSTATGNVRITELT